MSKTSREYSLGTQSALATLGALIAAGRRRNAWPRAELAERLGVDTKTVTRIERGAPTVGVGVVFDAAVLCGVALFDASPDELPARERRAKAELALLPARVRDTEVEVSDEF